MTRKNGSENVLFKSGLRRVNPKGGNWTIGRKPKLKLLRKINMASLDSAATHSAIHSINRTRQKRNERGIGRLALDYGYGWHGWYPWSRACLWHRQVQAPKGSRASRRSRVEVG